MEPNSNHDTIDILNLILISSELYFPFQSTNYHLHKGICLVTENPTHADELLNVLEQIGDCKIISALKSRDYKKIWNFELAIHPLHRYDKEEDLHDFCTCNNCLAVLLAGGIVPDFMDDICHIIILPTGSYDTSALRNLTADIQSIKSFMRKYPSEMMSVISQFGTSSEAIKYAGCPELYRYFSLASHIYRLWYRSLHNQPETDARFHSILQNMENILVKSDDYIEDIDITDIFISLFLRYADTHNEDFFPINNMDGTALGKLQEGNAILYNDYLYFTPDCLLKKICSPIINTFGWSTIKKCLQSSGILYCNDVKKTNFTCKKAFVNVYGETVRKRFICLQKEFFIPLDGLAPEEKRREKCILEP